MHKIWVLAMAWPLATANLSPPTSKPPEAAIDSVSAPHVTVSLLTEQETVAPGAGFYAGLQFAVEDHWHIYWENPGDSGQPPTVRWTLPDGFTAEAMQWPVPERQPVGPLVNYGYSGTVLFPVPMHAPMQGFSGAKAVLKADVRWLVCAEMCIPGHATLTTEIASGATRANPSHSPRFSAARALLPTPPPPGWNIRGTTSRDGFALEVTVPPGSPSWRDAVFFPQQALQIENAGTQVFTKTLTGFSLRIPHAIQPGDPIAHLAGVLRLDPSVSAQPVQALIIDPVLEEAAQTPLQWALLLAFFGGVLLNLMPCVFPVLSIKFMTFITMAHGERARMRQHAWLYGAGVLVSFWLLTAALLALRSVGQQIGWGFQLQSPYFVVVLASLLFGLSLNLLGVFEMGASWMGMGQSLANRSGAGGAFFTGVLATVVATPCTAPWMGTAVGFALSQPAAVCMLVFTALALGLALPYVALAHAPGLIRWLPRPGAWMVTLRQLMAFPLLATVIWLVWVLALQTHPTVVAALLVDFLLLAIAAWMLGRWPGRRLGWLGALCLMTLAVGISLWQVTSFASTTPPRSAAADTVQDGDGLQWERFSPERVVALRDAGRPIFIDFTAAWCVSCQVNEALVFGSAPVRQKIKDLGMVLLRADWTSQDPIITQTLASFGRSGVPLYVMYGKGKDAPAVILPEVITAGLVLEELAKLP